MGSASGVLSGATSKALDLVRPPVSPLVAGAAADPAQSKSLARAAVAAGQGRGGLRTAAGPIGATFGALNAVPAA